MKTGRRDFLKMGVAAAASPAALAFGGTRERAGASSIFKTNPYVQLLDGDTVAVSWLTTSQATGRVKWTQEGLSRLNNSASDINGAGIEAWDETDGLRDVGRLLHRATISGIDPSKPLWFRAFSRPVTEVTSYNGPTYGGAEETRDGAIGRMVERDASGNVTVRWSMLNDLHECVSWTDGKAGPIYDAFIPLIGDDAAFCVLNGDIINTSDKEEYVTTLLGRLASVSTASSGDGRGAGAPCWFLRGNHETRGGYARDLRDRLALKDGRYYGAATIGGARFMFLDSGEDKEDSVGAYAGMTDFDEYVRREIRWIASEIASPAWTGARARIVVQHIPPGAKPSRRYALTSALTGANVTLMMCGHWHQWKWSDAGANSQSPYPIIVGGGPGRYISDPSNSGYDQPTLVKCELTYNENGAEPASLAVRVLAIDSISSGTATVAAAPAFETVLSAPATPLFYSCVWTGAGDGRTFSDPQNWRDGVPPANGGETVYFSGCAGELVDDLASFRPTAILFGPDIGDVVIAPGEEKSSAAGAQIGVEYVVNGSARSSVTFREAVGFYYSINVRLASEDAPVKFEGGAAGSKITNHSVIYGDYTLRGEANWTLAQKTVVSRGSSVSGPGITLMNPHLLCIMEGATVEVKDVVVVDVVTDTETTTAIPTDYYDASRPQELACLVGVNRGTFIVGGTASFTCESGFAYIYPATPNKVKSAEEVTADKSGVFYINRLDVSVAYSSQRLYLNNMRDNPDAIVVGPGGINIASSGSRLWAYAPTNKLRSYADCTIGNAVEDGGVTDWPMVYYYNDPGRSLVLDTSPTGWRGDDTPHVMTVMGTIASSAASSYHVTATGGGTVVWAAQPSSSASPFSGGLTASEGVTVSVMPGSRPGSGAVDMEAGTTLAVAASGETGELGLATLASGAALSFSFTSADAAPVMKFASGGGLSLSGPVAVKFAASGAAPEADAKFVLTSGAGLSDSDAAKLSASDAPDWVSSIGVENGEIVVTTREAGGLRVFLR